MSAWDDFLEIHSILNFRLHTGIIFLLCNHGKSWKISWEFSPPFCQWIFSTHSSMLAWIEARIFFILAEVHTSDQECDSMCMLLGLQIDLTLKLNIHPSPSCRESLCTTMYIHVWIPIFVPLYAQNTYIGALCEHLLSEFKIQLFGLQMDIHACMSKMEYPYRTLPLVNWIVSCNLLCNHYLILLLQKKRVLTSSDSELECSVKPKE